MTAVPPPIAPQEGNTCRGTSWCWKRQLVGIFFIQALNKTISSEERPCVRKLKIVFQQLPKISFKISEKTPLSKSSWDNKYRVTRRLRIQTIATVLCYVSLKHPTCQIDSILYHSQTFSFAQVHNIQPKSQEFALKLVKASNQKPLSIAKAVESFLTKA